ncbi:MAG TPA: acetoacetate decarboxylase family protein [Microbacterium sp.]|nr:acetoacetate decarboxylase family protein [Microbacterium sp.]
MMNILLTPVRALLSLVPSPVPRRQKRLTATCAEVDGIPYRMPVDTSDAAVLMAGFPISLDAARRLLPGSELHPLSIGRGTGILLVTVVDYRATDIGSYIEYSIAVAVTRGRRPAPPIVPLLAQRAFGMGQYVVDLPVSTEVSVKGGKGIWGMPKHQSSLDFIVTPDRASALYDLDGELACLVDIARPARTRLPLKLAAVNYCTFRGMLMKSTIYFQGAADIAIGRAARGRLVLGDHPVGRALRELGVGPSPLATVYLGQTTGVLDDHFESWFLTAPTPEAAAVQAAASGDDLESVVSLGRGEQWPPPPDRSRVPDEVRVGVAS